MTAADVAAHEAGFHRRNLLQPLPATATAEQLLLRAEALARKADVIAAAGPSHRLYGRLGEYEQAAEEALLRAVAHTEQPKGW